MSFPAAAPRCRSLLCSSPPGCRFCSPRLAESAKFLPVSPPSVCQHQPSPSRCVPARNQNLQTHTHKVPPAVWCAAPRRHSSVEKVLERGRDSLRLGSSLSLSRFSPVSFPRPRRLSARRRSEKESIRSNDPRHGGLSRRLTAGRVAWRERERTKTER